MITRFEYVSELLRERRSIFPASYTGAKVEERTIMEILENANWAPNHKNTEPWRFVVFCDDALLSLGEYLANYYLDHTPEDKFSENKYKKTLEKALKSSHVIAICMQRDPKGSVPEWEELAAVACAVQNMYLSCSSLELGCYWSSPKAIVDADKFLQLRDGEQCLGFFYIGVPVKNLKYNAKRKPIQDKVRWRRG